MGTPYRKHIPSGLPVPPPKPWRWTESTAQPFFRVEPFPLAAYRIGVLIFFVVWGLSVASLGISVAYVVFHFVQKFW